MNERKLVDFLKEFAVFAGKLALPYYGKVATHTKMIKTAQSLRESEVTVIDHAIQEILLAELIRKGYTNLAFNGEEDTHLKFFFRTDYENGVTLHCDPIDGTRAFIQGKNRFASGYGLSHAKNGEHEFFASVIYSPLEKILYWSLNDQRSRHSVEKNPPKTIVERMLNPEGLKKTKECGFSRFIVGNAHLAVVEVALGQIGAVMLDDVEVHDALIPYSFAQGYGIYPYDENGVKIKKRKLKHDSTGFARMNRVYYFANKEIRDELIPIISNPKNTMR